MMGRKKAFQSKLFYQRINLEKRIRKDHMLRLIDQHIDFDFVFKEIMLPSLTPIIEPKMTKIAGNSTILPRYQ